MICHRCTVINIITLYIRHSFSHCINGAGDFCRKNKSDNASSKIYANYIVLTSDFWNVNKIIAGRNNRNNQSTMFAMLDFAVTVSKAN